MICFICSFILGNAIDSTGQLGIRSRFATLTVLVPPEPPKIIQGDHLITTEDREIELECVSVGGKPAAEVIYYITLLYTFFFFIFICKPTVKNNNYKKKWKKIIHILCSFVCFIILMTIPLVISLFN